MVKRVQQFLFSGCFFVVSLRFCIVLIVASIVKACIPDSENNRASFGALNV
jgi:hypothetical protein